MKGEQRAAIFILLLGLGFQLTSEAQGASGFLEGLGNAFKQMGSDMKDVVQGRAQGEANQTQVEDANVNASEPSLGAEAQDRQLLKEIQYRLSALGYLPGSVDGLMSKQTAFAIRKYQRASGIAVDGMPSAQLLALLRSVTSDLKIPADIATTQSPNPGISSSIGSAFNKITGSISNVLGTSNTNALVEVTKQTALTMGMNQAAMSGVPMEAITTTAAALGQTPITPSPMLNVQANTTQPLNMGTASSGSSQSYLDRMVAESDAMVYQRAQNISPYDREMARRSGIDLDRQVAQQLEGYEKYKRDAAEINRRTSVQAAPATGTSSTAAGQALPSVLAGRWEGKVTYNPKDISPTLPGRSGQQTRVRLDVDPYRGLLAATYPDLGCQGIMRANSSVPAKAGANQHELNDYPLEERLVAGSNCTDGGTVYLTHWSAYQPGPTAKKGQLMFKWANPTTKKPAMFGRLLPVSDVIDKQAIDDIARKADKNYVATTTKSLEPIRQRSAKEVAEKFADKGITEDEVKLLVEAAPYAHLSNNVYNEKIKKGDVFMGWEIIGEDKRFYYYARAYVRADEVVIAYQGTNGIGDALLVDLLGSVTGSFQDIYAKQFAEQVIKAYPGKRITVTGHSMGGRFAQVALMANKTISKAYTFNSAPISLVTGIKGVFREEDLVRATQNTFAIRETGDALETLAGWNYGHFADVNFVDDRNTLTAVADIPALIGSHRISAMANGLQCVADYYHATGVCA